MPALCVQAAVDKLRDDAVVVPLQQQAAAAGGATGPAKGTAAKVQDSLLGSAVDPDLADASAAGAALVKQQGERAGGKAGGAGSQAGAAAGKQGVTRIPQPAAGGRAAEGAQGGGLSVSCCTNMFYAQR